MTRSLRRQFIWSFLSLWAVIGMIAPTLGWTCPMSGRVASTPASVCPCAPKDSSTGLVAAMHDCCERVPLPNSDTSGDKRHDAPTLPSLNNARQVASEVSNLYPASFFALPVAAHARELQFISSPHESLAPPRLASSVLTSLHSGRSPPH